MIFENGKTCICLHTDFEKDFKNLVTQAIKNAKWDFQPSCNCNVSQQQQINAAYYNRRGRFQLRRGAPELALGYLKEALKLKDTTAYQDDYGMALIDVQRLRKDDTLEDWLNQEVEPQLTLHNPDEDYGFRYDYINVVGRQGDNFDRLSARLEELKSLGESTYWSYSMGTCAYGLPQVERSSSEDSAIVCCEIRAHMHRVPMYTASFP